MTLFLGRHECLFNPDRGIMTDQNGESEPVSESTGVTHRSTENSKPAASLKAHPSMDGDFYKLELFSSRGLDQVHFLC